MTFEELHQELAEQLALALRRALALKGWSQRELSRQAGVSISQVVSALSGEANPTLSTIVKLSSTLGVDVLSPRLEPFGTSAEDAGENAGPVALRVTFPQRAGGSISLTPIPAPQWMMEGPPGRVYPVIAPRELEEAAERFGVSALEEMVLDQLPVHIAKPLLQTLSSIFQRPVGSGEEPSQERQAE